MQLIGQIKNHKTSKNFPFFGSCNISFDKSIKKCKKSPVVYVHYYFATDAFYSSANVTIWFWSQLKNEFFLAILHVKLASLQLFFSGRDSSSLDSTGLSSSGFIIKGVTFGNEMPEEVLAVPAKSHIGDGR